MNEKQILIRTTEEGDWMQLVVDGKVLTENHRLTAQDVLEALGIPFTEEEYDGEA